MCEIFLLLSDRLVLISNIETYMLGIILFILSEMHQEKGSGLVPWPNRLKAAPPRLEEVGVTPEEFHEDTVSFWNSMITLFNVVVYCPCGLFIILSC